MKVNVVLGNCYLSLDIHYLFSFVNNKGKLINEWNLEIKARFKTSVELLESMHKACIFFTDNAEKTKVDHSRGFAVSTEVSVTLRAHDRQTRLLHLCVS
jgi:hypothetical protein